MILISAGSHFPNCLLGGLYRSAARNAFEFMAYPGVSGKNAIFSRYHVSRISSNRYFAHLFARSSTAASYAFALSMAT
jgi:hypothetical protein